MKCAVDQFGKDNVVLLVCKSDLDPLHGLGALVNYTSVVEQSASAFYGIVARQIGVPTIEFVATDAPLGSAYVEDGRYDVFSRQFYVRVRDRLSRKLGALAIEYLGGDDVLMDSDRFAGCDKISFARKVGARYYRPEDTPALREEIDRSQPLLIDSDSEYESVAISLLPDFLPSYLSEEFKSYQTRSQKWAHFKSYFSILGWYGNVGFCFAAALAKLKGAKIVACQCGGGYGQYEVFHNEMVERKFSDFFITWGWEDSHYQGGGCCRCRSPILPELRSVVIAFDQDLQLPSGLARQYRNTRSD